MTKRAQQRMQMLIPVIALTAIGVAAALGMVNLQPGSFDLRQQASSGYQNVETCKDSFTARFGDNFNLAGESWDRSSGNEITEGKLRQVIGPNRDDGVWLARRKNAKGDFKATLTVESINFEPATNESATATLRFGRNDRNWFGITLSKRIDKIYVKAESEDNGVVEEAAVQPLAFELPVTLVLTRQGSTASYSVTKDGSSQTLPNKEGVDAGQGHVSIITNDFNVDGKPVRIKYDRLTFECP